MGGSFRHLFRDSVLLVAPVLQHPTTRRAPSSRRHPPSSRSRGCRSPMRLAPGPVRLAAQNCPILRARPSPPSRPGGSSLRHHLRRTASRSPQASGSTSPGSKSTRTVSKTVFDYHRLIRKRTTSGTNAKFSTMKIKYPFHFKLFRSVGVIMTTKKSASLSAHHPTGYALAIGTPTPNPVCRNTDCSSLGANMERQDLRDVHPRDLGGGGHGLADVLYHYK